MPLGVAQPSVAMVTANIGTEMVTVCFVCFLTLVQFEIRCRVPSVGGWWFLQWLHCFGRVANLNKTRHRRCPSPQVSR